MDHGLPPQSGPVTADTPLSAMPRWTVRLAARPGATRCPSPRPRPAGHRGSRGAGAPSRTRSVARPRAWPSDKGYRQHSCRNTLQGLSSSPRVPPEPAFGARETGGGGETGAILSATKRTFWLNSLAPRNMTGSVVRICQRNTPKPHSMDRPLDRAAGRAQRDLDLRAHSRGALALGAGPPPAAAHAAHRVEPWSWNSTNVGTLARLPRCGRPGPLWRAPGPVRAAVGRRARRPAPPDPLAGVFLHESGRYPRYVGPQGQLREQGQKVLAS